MKTQIFSFFLILSFGNLQSQDIHFSQFWEPMAHANPAQIGNFDGVFKLHTQYRNQWSQFNTPLTTMFGDITFKMAKEQNYWAFSFSFLRDQLSYLSYHQLRMAGSISHQRKMSKRITAGVGFQGGTRLTSINYNRLTFDRQWDANSGQFLQSNPHFETLNIDDVYTPFLSLGTSVHYDKKNNLHTVDASAMYITNNKNEDFVFYQPFKFAFNYHSYFLIKDKFTIMPKLGIISTASANSINSGLLVKMAFDDKKYIYGGINYRWGVDRNGDAIIPIIGYKVNRLKIGVSYDVVLSGLSQEGLKRAYELSLSYVVKSPSTKFYSIDCLRL